MSPSDSERRDSTGGEPTGDNEPFQLKQLLGRLARLFLGILFLLACVAGLAHWLRPELEAVGRYFVDHFGLLGMALGTFIADGFHFPVPPQFYMLIGIAAKTPTVSMLAVICAASVAGGTAGYVFARRLAKLKFFSRLLRKSSHWVREIGDKHGYRLVLGVSLTPIAYSVLCYLAGAYRLPKRLYVLLAVLRVPKLILYYYLVRLGWGIG